MKPIGDRQSILWPNYALAFLREILDRRRLGLSVTFTFKLTRRYINTILEFTLSDFGIFYVEIFLLVFGSLIVWGHLKSSNSFGLIVVLIINIYIAVIITIKLLRNEFDKSF